MEKTTTSVSVSKTDFANIKDNALLMGFFKDKTALSSELKKLDNETNNAISCYIRDMNFKGDKGEARTVYLNKKITSTRKN